MVIILFFNKTKQIIEDRVNDLLEYVHGYCADRFDTYDKFKKINLQIKQLYSQIDVLANLLDTAIEDISQKDVFTISTDYTTEQTFLTFHWLYKNKLHSRQICSFNSVSEKLVSHSVIDETKLGLYYITVSILKEDKVIEQKYIVNKDSNEIMLMN